MNAVKQRSEQRIHKLEVVGGKLLVRINKLGLRSFKSFGPKRVVITLDKGFIVFSGPNGSGKSNLVDAMRFVLGDLSARSLRADRMADVIFSGSPGIRASKSAHVYLQFDNSERKIPVDVGVVTISREVYKSGESKYRLNGKLISRSKLLDILSIAGISYSGYNIIMQGTITRLADLNPDDRRKVIEDLVGIAEYNAKKAGAQTQLRQANINLRVAAARMDEIQRRLESLEMERNDALRYNFIQKEIKNLQAIITFHEFSQLQKEISALEVKFQVKRSELEKIKKQRSSLQLLRDKVESERRRFDEEIAEKGGSRLIIIQKSVGDISSQIAGLKTEIESSTMSLTRINAIRGKREQQLKSLSFDIQVSFNSLKEIKSERDTLAKKLKKKIFVYNNLSENLSNTKEKLGDATSKIEIVEDDLAKLNQNIMKLDTQIKVNTAENKLLCESLKILETRRESFVSTLSSLHEHLEQLRNLENEEYKSLIEISGIIEKKTLDTENIVVALDEAERTAKLARNAVVEFEAKYSLIESLTTEDKALKRIENMMEDGAISGVYGRLERLIEVKLQYKKAVEVASSGWLKAIVVEDVENALKCVENLKKMKIGRIKVIPLKQVANSQIVNAPRIKGVIGPVSTLIRCNENYVPAVNFVFGDTILTAGEKSAFLTSKAGYRAVDLNGDLYENGGGIESGYYRDPVNIYSLIPSKDTVESLDKNVESLEIILNKRKTYISSVEEEVIRLNEDRIRRSDIISVMKREIDVIEQNIRRVKTNVEVLNERLLHTAKKVEKGQETQSVSLSKKTEEDKRFRELIEKKDSLKLLTKNSNILRYDAEQKTLNTDINGLQRELVKIESKVAFLESNLNVTLKPEIDRIKEEVGTIIEQTSILKEKIAVAQLNLRKANEQLFELEKTRLHLSDTLLSVKDEKQNFDFKLDEINIQLTKTSSQYDLLNERLHRSGLELEAKKIDLRYLKEKLDDQEIRELNNVLVKDLRIIQKLLKTMGFELEKLGSVNQLAIYQYNKQKENYKQFSIRRNELEGDRKAILQFMEDIDQQKKETLIRAYNEINANFIKIFNKLTGGGKGYLKLQNDIDPFAGGLDIFVQFPGKSQRLIAGSSGGEKSVTAISFIFAIQKLVPASFYIFDEIAAHLDPFNTERLADILKEQSSESQFIVVTLRDVIIDRSDRVVGVYLQNGVSRTISVKLVGAST